VEDIARYTRSELLLIKEKNGSSKGERYLKGEIIINKNLKGD
jgi:hypothetical protein